MKKICVVISSRASFSRFRMALKEINNKSDLNVILTASAANEFYGNVKQQLIEDNIKGIQEINSLCNDSSLVGQVKTTSETMNRLAEVFEKLMPDIVVTIADRYETIATAIAASYMNISLVHIQGGEVTGNIDEKVRHAVTKLSDFHLVSTNRAKQFLIKMGESEDRIKVTGCPSCDIAEHALKNSMNISEITKKYMPNGITMNRKIIELSDRDYYVVIFHSTTNELETLHDRLCALLSAINKAGKKCLWVRGNVDAGASKIDELISDNSSIYSIPPMESEDFLHLLIHSAGVIGNSSVAIRECSYLGIPAVNIGSRQYGRERGNNVIDVGDSEQEIVEGISQIGKMKCSQSLLYGNGHAGHKIAEYILNYDLPPKKSITYVEEI